MSGGSKSAVFTAIGANAVVSVAKLVGFAFTGSGSMLAEGLHSIADVGNQALLAVGMTRSHLPPDDTHPFGYGREAFVWSIISAVGIFFVGCGVSVTHGIQSLVAAAHAEHGASGGGALALGILGLSFLMEGGSFVVAMRGLAADARDAGQGFFEYLRETEDPFGVAVFLEDSAALVGILIAVAAVGMSAYTGDPKWDAIGSIAIGVLLGGIAAFLIRKNRSYLVGLRVKPEISAEIRALIESDPAVERVVEQRAVVSGTDEYRVSTEIDFDGAYMADKWLESHDIAELAGNTGTPEGLREFLQAYTESVLDTIGAEIDRIEREIGEKMPKARNIDLEPD